MGRKLKIIIMLTVISVSISSDLLVLSNYLNNGALCLDGSPGVFKFQKGTSEVNKWLIIFGGGGWCFSEEDCNRRAHSGMGSSKAVTVAKDDNADLAALYAPLHIFHGWTVASPLYCDGGSFTGNNESVYQGEKLFYRGSRILSSFISDIAALGAINATEIVVSGFSAGGLSAIIHVDKFKLAYPDALVTALSESGFFITRDYAHCPLPFKTSLTAMFHLMNSSAGVHPDCISASLGHGRTAAKCVSAFDTLRYVASPVFALQSRYDVWVIANVYCLSVGKWRDRAKITESGNEVQRAFLDAFDPIHANNTNTSSHYGLLDACPRHAVQDMNWNPALFWDKIRTSEEGGGDRDRDGDGTAARTAKSVDGGGGLSQKELFVEWYRLQRLNHRRRVSIHGVDRSGSGSATSVIGHSLPVPVSVQHHYHFPPPMGKTCGDIDTDSSSDKGNGIGAVAKSGRRRQRQTVRRVLEGDSNNEQNRTRRDTLVGINK